jgi:hypothetical protein
MQANGAVADTPRGPRLGSVTLLKGRRGPRERLVLETSDPATGPAFARACERTFAHAHATLPPGESALPALAAMMLGDSVPATAILEAWVAGRADADAAPAGGGVVSLPLLAARHLAWTGDFVMARRLWPRPRDVQRWAVPMARDGTLAAELGAVVGGLLRELIALAEAAADTDAAASLAADARSLLREARGGALRPESSEFLVAAALGAFDPDPPRFDPLRPEPARSRIALSDAASAVLHAWAGLSLGHTPAATSWDALLAVVGADLPVPGPPDGPDWADMLVREAAALAVAAGVLGLVGAAPDAPKMRLRLRPHLPDAWSELTVRNLAMAEARFDVRISREGARRTYAIEQTAGGLPATVILEMLVPGPALRSVDVDGRPAKLDIRPFGPGFLIPVQLVADDVRVVCVEGAGF